MSTAEGRLVTAARHLVLDRALRLVRGLPEPVARDRMRQIESDLWEHAAAHRARGGSDRALAAAILGRLVRGLPADVVWRSEQVVAARGVRARSSTLERRPRVHLDGSSRPFDPTNGLVVTDAVTVEEADDTVFRLLQAGAIGSLVAIGFGGGL